MAITNLRIVPIILAPLPFLGSDQFACESLTGVDGEGPVIRGWHDYFTPSPLERKCQLSLPHNTVNSPAFLTPKFNNVYCHACTQKLAKNASSSRILRFMPLRAHSVPIIAPWAEHFSSCQIGWSLKLSAPPESRVAEVL